MITQSHYKHVLIAIAALFGALAMTSSVKAATDEEQLARYLAEAKTVAQNIETFDTLDYVVFTQQQWERLHESHSKDVIVHWPDGHQTQGIEKHIEDLKAMFVYAPDTRIKIHSIKFGSGEGTAVIGIKTLR